MAKIVEPIVGKRTPDMRWEIDPMPASQQARAIEAGMSRHQMVPLKLREDTDELVASVITRVRPHLEWIDEHDSLAYIPPDLKWYDRHSRRHHWDEDDVIHIAKGEVVEVPFARAVVLLRDAPEGYGYLVEEAEKVVAPKPKRKRAPRKRKTTTKKKAAPANNELPLPSET